MAESRKIDKFMEYTPTKFINLGDGLKSAYSLSHLSVNREL